MRIVADIDAYSCSSETPLVDVIHRINAVEGLFQVVVDQNNAFLGTITDGDIRRSILQGISLEAAADTCVFRDATVGYADEASKDLERRLLSVDNARPFLPILDRERRVVSIALLEWLAAESPFGLIMAGGRGSRLGDRTNTIPKPMLEVGGQPILAHILKSLDEARVDPIFISVHYLACQIENFVANWEGQAQLKILHESEPLGTAGALGLIPNEVRRPVLVMNADILTNLDIPGMMAYHRRHANDGTVAVATHEVLIPYGVIDQTQDGLFEGIREKPVIANFVSSGIYLLEPAFRALVPANRRLDMPNLLDRGKKIGLQIGLYPVHEYWTDIGQPDDLDAADRRMRNRNSDEAELG
jgi:UDP-2,4-diacetamido-2,4,6-trideoxy-beta-L-gulopyranose hydrolase